MRVAVVATIACCALVAPAPGTPADAPFTGEWQIDLRNAQEKRAKVDCGNAGFILSQVGEDISGEHWMATARCGRVNEGGTVAGKAYGRTATLTVTSGRDGSIVRGQARIKGSSMHWRVLEELAPGEPATDSGLILHGGVLRKVKK